MSGSTTPLPSPNPLMLSGKYLSWGTLTAAAKHGRTILLNLGVRHGQHAVTVARFVNPPGFGFAAPHAAYLAGVTGYTVRDGVELHADSPTPTLYGPGQVLALDVRAALAGMPGALPGRTRLQDVEDEVSATGGPVALELFRAPGRMIDRTDSAELDALRALDFSERELADLFSGAHRRDGKRADARRERRRILEQKKAGGAPAIPAPALPAAPVASSPTERAT